MPPFFCFLFVFLSAPGGTGLPPSFARPASCLVVWKARRNFSNRCWILEYVGDEQLTFPPPIWKTCVERHLTVGSEYGPLVNDCVFLFTEGQLEFAFDSGLKCSRRVFRAFAVLDSIDRLYCCAVRKDCA